jgi:prevent-host-death family protein
MEAVMKATPQNTWQLYTAKNQLSELIERAAETPQTITVRGKEAVVVLSAQEYRKIREPKKKLTDILRGSLSDGVELYLERDKSVIERGTPVEFLN